jgi:hypothetical protein
MCDLSISSLALSQPVMPTHQVMKHLRSQTLRGHLLHVVKRSDYAGIVAWKRLSRGVLDMGYVQIRLVE